MTEPRMTDPDVDIFALIPETKTPKRKAVVAKKPPETTGTKVIVITDEDTNIICITTPEYLGHLTLPTDGDGNIIAVTQEHILITGSNLAEGQRLLNEFDEDPWLP